MNDELRNKYPISTFGGTTQNELVGFIQQEITKSLWDLYEYMGQFPDELNLAVMYERIKLIEDEQKENQSNDQKPRNPNRRNR